MRCIWCQRELTEDRSSVTFIPFMENNVAVLCFPCIGDLAKNVDVIKDNDPAFPCFECELFENYHAQNPDNCVKWLSHNGKCPQDKETSMPNDGLHLTLKGRGETSPRMSRPVSAPFQGR